MDETRDNNNPNVEKERYDNLKEIFGKTLGVIIDKFGQNDQRMAIFVIVVVFLVIVVVFSLISFMSNLSNIF